MTEATLSAMRALSLIAFGLMVYAGAPAAERQAYKYVDEKGNVVYSQTPPTQGKDAKKVDISPANAGRGGYVGGGGANTYPYQQSYSSREQYQQAMQEQRKRREEAMQKRLADLQAECNRNRGTDCNNPETLRRMEAQSVPGGRNYPRR